MPSADLSRLTAIVSTSDHPCGIGRLVRSLRRRYPDLRLLVADASRDPQPIAGVDAVRVPVGTVPAAGRNALLARVRTPYFLLLEDRLELPRKAGVEQLLALAADNRLDVAAGDCLGCRRVLGLFTKRAPQPGHAILENSGGQLVLQSGHRPSGNDFLACDVAHNYFVARTDKVRAIGGWDQQLGADDRIEFFVRAQRFGLRTGVCPSAVAHRWNDGPTATRETSDLSAVLASLASAQTADAAVPARAA